MKIHNIRSVLTNTAKWKQISCALFSPWNDGTICTSNPLDTGFSNHLLCTIWSDMEEAIVSNILNSELL